VVVGVPLVGVVVVGALLGVLRASGLVLAVAAFVVVGVCGSEWGGSGEGVGSLFLLLGK